MKGMEKIELVIKIPKAYYELVLERCKEPVLLNAFKNGTPIDLEGLKSDMKALNCGYPYGLDYLLDCLDKRLGIKIAGADKESEVEDGLSRSTLRLE